MDLPDPDSSKEARYQRVAEAIIGLLLRGGPDSLRYATIARRAEVSRAWLYKYFGKDRDALLAFAVKLFGDRFAEVDRSLAADDVPTWRDNVLDATRRGLADTAAAPWTMKLWFRYRHARDVLGEGLRDVQRRHVEAFVADMPGPLRRDATRAARFARWLTAARLGLYHHWIEDRDEADEEQVMALVGAMVDGFVDRA